MKNKKTLFVSIILFSGIITLTIPASGQTFPSGIKRTSLQQYDLSIPGKEFIQARIDIDPGVTAPKHKHPGEEIIYVLEGVFEYQIEGNLPVKLKAGDVLFVPANAYHSAKNIGSGNAGELATYIVEKGKPLITLAK